MPRTLISVGGWCGPALCLGKLGLRPAAFPFDFSRVTLDGVTHFVRNGFSRGFFPSGPRPYRPECVGMWVLFRGQHTAFAHFDLNDPKIITGFERKFDRWNKALAGELGPVTFMRTVTARNPREELDLIDEFQAALAERNPDLDYRMAVAVHDQGTDGTTMLAPLNHRTSLWSIEYTEDAQHTLFDRSQQGYAQLVAHALDDDSWPPRAPDRVAFAQWRVDELGAAPASTCVDAGSFPWRTHDNIALIDGVASVGGTCTGVGSTKAEMIVDERGEPVASVCHKCGNTDHHKAGRPARTDRPFTDEEDELLLVHLYKIITGGDRVEAVEQLAHEMNRGAFEVICRLQFLTQASTKLTEGLGLDD